MGRTTNLINGVISGKVGAQVGYKLQNDKQPQGVRAYQPIVHNPKTYAQAAHRAKIRPAQLFYTTFEPVLNHAFLPAGSRGKNRFRFLSLAYRNPVIPRVLKGENNIPYNVPYKVSEGDLALDNYTRKYNGETTYDTYVTFNLLGYDYLGDSIANISTTLIYYNGLLRNGDELVTLALYTDGVNIYTDVRCLVLNINDNLNTGHYLELGPCFWSLDGPDDNFAIRGSDGISVLAAALIISRRTGDTFHYTNSFLCMSQYAIDNLAPTEQAVVESYMSPGGQIDSSLILQQAQQADTAPHITGAEMIDFTAKSGYDINNFGYEQIAVANFSDGFKKVVLDGTQLTATGNDGMEWAINDYDGNPSSMSMITLDGSPTIQLAEVQAAGFMLIP